MQESKQYLAAFKARQAPAIVVSEDTHALDKPQIKFEQLLNAAWWIKRHVVHFVSQQSAVHCRVSSCLTMFMLWFAACRTCCSA